MSAIQDYIVGSIFEYLDHRLSLDDFRVAFAGTYAYVRQKAPQDEQCGRLMNRLVGPFGEFSAGYRSEASLREELANAIRPFKRTSANPLTIERSLAQPLMTSEPVDVYITFGRLQQPRKLQPWERIFVPAIADTNLEIHAG